MALFHWLAQKMALSIFNWKNITFWLVALSNWNFWFFLLKMLTSVSKDDAVKHSVLCTKFQFLSISLCSQMSTRNSSSTHSNRIISLSSSHKLPSSYTKTSIPLEIMTKFSQYSKQFVNPKKVNFRHERKSSNFSNILWETLREALMYLAHKFFFSFFFLQRKWHVWYWLLCAVFLFDTINSVIDRSYEKKYFTIISPS